MPTDEVIENKDVFEENTSVTGDDTNGQISVDKENIDELNQESEQMDSDDNTLSPSFDPLPDTEGDETSESSVESRDDSDSDANDSNKCGEPGTDAADTADAVQADDNADDGAVAGVEAESDSDTQPDNETAEGSEPESDAIVDGHDEEDPCDELCDETDTDTDTDDSETTGDVVIESDGHATVPPDLPNIDKAREKPVSLRDSIHSEYDDIDRKSRVPRTVKVAAGAIAAVAAAAALVTSTVAVMVVEIHPNVIGGETIASQQADGIDGSGKKISASYTVGDALHSSNFDDPPDGPEILSWTDCWYTVAPGAESVIAEIESAGKGSRIDLSDGTSIDVDGRYASRAGNFDAGIDIEGIAKLYGGDDGWIAIRYDASHVLVGKRVADGASEGE